MSLLGSLLVYEGELWGHLGVTLGSLWANIDVDLHVQRISYRPVFGPSGPINRKHTFTPMFLLVKEAKRIPRIRTARREEASGRG